MMASGICCRLLPVLPQNIDLAAAGHIFGLSASDAAGQQLLLRLAPAILASAAPRAVYAAFSLQGAETPKTLRGPETEKSGNIALSAADGAAKALLSGLDITAHLAGCSGFMLLGVTLGAGADGAIRRAAVGDVAAGAAADALASALCEQVCDDAERQLRQILSAQGLFCTGRFSPGYGDWPLETQHKIAELLDLNKTIGVQVAQSCLMLPRKSVTALLGMADHPVSGKPAGCGHCALKTGCAFRRKGKFCFET